MKYATGTHFAAHNTYKMHAPVFPYNTIVYIDYTFEQMKKKYRQDHNLGREKIEWVILENA